MFNIDKEFTLKVAEDILSIHSPTGYTKDATNKIDYYLNHLGYTSKKTPKGNLIVEITGENNDYTVGLSAHIDTLGLMVRSIDSKGGLNFTVLGGPILNTYDGEYCTVITRDNRRYRGTVLSKSPSVHVYKDSKSRKRDENNMYIRLDEKVKTKKDVLKLGISNGDIIAIDQKVELTDSGFIKSRFLDDKISVALIIGFLKMLKDNKVKPKFKLKLMFSVYEEVGHGMAWIPQDISELLSVDMGAIGLDLECSEYDVSICAKDSSGPYDYEMVSTLIKLAKENDLNYVVDIYPMYGSDTSAALRGGNNIKGALIGPGVHASHGMERTHYEAVENTMKLLYLYLVK